MQKNDQKDLHPGHSLPGRGKGKAKTLYADEYAVDEGM